MSRACASAPRRELEREAVDERPVLDGPVSLDPHLPRDGRLAARLEESAVRRHIVLQARVAVRVKVQQVHLVALDHHARVRGADAARADDADSRALKQLPDKQRGQPALVLAGAHEDIRLRARARRLVLRIEYAIRSAHTGAHVPLNSEPRCRTGLHWHELSGRLRGLGDSIQDLLI
jgi:hypothetical protein